MPPTIPIPEHRVSSEFDSDARKAYRHVALHTQGCTVGPMPAQDFLDKFLPKPKARYPNPRSKKNILHCIPTRRRYKPFVKTMGDMCPGFEFVSLSALTENDPNLGPKLCPDTAVYPSGVKRTSPCDWGLMDFFVEWKPDQDFDGYDGTFESSQTLEDESTRAKELRGRIFSYAARLMDCQHRLFVFAVDIYRDCARLYRFDPSCIVVSDRIYFRNDPRPLDEFFARYSALSHAQRGYDPTVTLANDTEKVLFQTCIRDYFERVQRNDLRTHPDVARLDGRILKIQVNDINGGAHWYLACKCSTIPVNSLPCGRFTRGYIAVPVPSDRCNDIGDTDKGKLFWLKDSWRPDSSESEASIYYELKAKGVPNLPDIRCAGDILVDSCTQETVNDTVLSDPGTECWRQPTGTIHHMIHVRIVAGLLIPFDHVENARELLLVGRDVLYAIATAFHKANIFHRDVSKGNIMMTERRGGSEGPWGVLNDWDRAGRVDAEETNRIGTWQFLSIYLLDILPKRHDIFDDLESLLWVLLFFAIHFFKYRGRFTMWVFEEVYDYFDSSRGKVPTGGSAKLGWVQTPQTNFECKPLQDFFDSFRLFHRDHIRKLSLSTDNEEKMKALEEYEAEIQKDIYGLASHFDNILNDPDIDWSGQEVHGARVEEISPQGQRNQLSNLDDEVNVPEPKPEPKPRIKAPPAKKNKRGKKRTRGDLELEDDDGHRHKRAAHVNNKGDGGQDVRPSRRRRRVLPAPPCDRVLRPRIQR